MSGQEFRNFTDTGWLDNIFMISNFIKFCIFTMTTDAAQFQQAFAGDDHRLEPWQQKTIQ
jgi:hypothetical protein